MEQSEINAHLVEHALAGKSVVRLKGVDGFVFGRGGDDSRHPPGPDAGLHGDIGPRAARPSRVRDRLFGSGTYEYDHHPDDGGCQSGPITAALIDAGTSIHTPAAVIADGSLSSQREVRATLGTIAEAALRAGIGPPATTVIARSPGSFQVAPQSRRRRHSTSTDGVRSPAGIGAAVAAPTVRTAISGTVPRPGLHR